MTEQLADLLAQYLASTKQPPAQLDSEGVFTIETGEGLLLGAAMLADGRLELFGNPGHVSPASMQRIVEPNHERSARDESNTAAVPGALVRWRDGDTEWGIHVDRQSGLVTLTGITAQLPWHVDGLAVLFKRFCDEHAAWAARLESEPLAEQEEQLAPAGAELQGFTRA